MKASKFEVNSVPAEIRYEETLTISGNAYPQSAIIIEFENNERVLEKTRVVSANANGEWVFEETIERTDDLGEKFVIFKNNNDKRSQVTLIEIENINYYNHAYGTFIKPINFRRNIITEGVRLNELVGKEFSVGEVKLKGHDLCRPCKYLHETLQQKNLIRELLRKAGLRCEILTSGKISVGDEIIS